MKTILITGGSSGIGEAVAIRFASRGGWNIVLSGRTPSKVAGVEDTLRSISTASIRAVSGDIRHDATILEIHSAVAELGNLSAIVNSAGLGRFARLAEFKPEDVREMLEVNFLGFVRVCQSCTPFLVQNGGGAIVNISSDADQSGFEGAIGYCGSKGAVAAASRALRLELLKHAIRVTTLSPGRVDTFFNNKSPGMRPGALLADHVAEVIEFAVTCDPMIDLTEIRMDSIRRLA